MALPAAARCSRYRAALRLGLRLAGLAGLRLGRAGLREVKMNGSYAPMPRGGELDFSADPVRTPRMPGRNLGAAAAPLGPSRATTLARWHAASTLLAGLGLPGVVRGLRRRERGGASAEPLPLLPLRAPRARRRSLALPRSQPEARGGAAAWHPESKDLPSSSLVTAPTATSRFVSAGGKSRGDFCSSHTQQGESGEERHSPSGQAVSQEDKLSIERLMVGMRELISVRGMFYTWHSGHEPPRPARPGPRGWGRERPLAPAPRRPALRGHPRRCKGTPGSGWNAVRGAYNATHTLQPPMPRSLRSLDDRVAGRGFSRRQEPSLRAV